MYKITIGENDYDVEPSKQNSTSGKIADKDYSLDVTGEGDKFHVIKDHKSHQVSIVKADYETRTFTVRVNSTEYELQAKDRYDLLLEELGMHDMAAGAVNDLKAPMPGLVLEVVAEAGQEVKKGDPLLVLEAMKMENVLKAETDAVIKSINVEKSQAVEKNFVLIEFDA